MPAQAGIHAGHSDFQKKDVDPRFRGDDGYRVEELLEHAVIFLICSYLRHLRLTLALV
jgi:hypothetical protein